MNRRNFLRFNALGALSLSAIYAMPHHQDHNHHSMHNMHHIPENQTNMDTSFIDIVENTELLSQDSIPINKDLKALPLLKNTSTKPNTFEATINIKEQNISLAKDKKTRFYTYNGVIPGPKIEVNEGDKVIIKVINHLDEPTTIHWHGLPVPPEQDGNPHDPIAPHTERVYEFTLPEGSAGTYWYHPHPHFITAKQVARGLAGAFVVKAKDSLSHLNEQDWFISDVGLDSEAKIRPNTLSDWLNGREGEFVLINGCFKPKINLTDTKRLRIYNATAARYLRLKIEGVDFIVAGSDGGLMQSPIVQEELFLCPASRAEVILKPNKDINIENAMLQSLYYDRDKMMQDTPNQDPINLATLNIESKSIELPKILREIPKLGIPTASKTITMSEDHSQMHGLSKKSTQEIKEALTQMFLMDNKIYDPNRIDLHSSEGAIEEWKIINKSHMDHPFHIHGAQFEIMRSNLKGKIITPKVRSLHDTINLRPDEEITIKIRQDFRGLRMYHCHILEHESLGMMGNLMVEQA